MSCRHQWYLSFPHRIIHSLIQLSCPRFVNTQIAMSCRHRWYLCFLHGMIHSLIQPSCYRFVNINPALPLTQRMSCKLLQYPVVLLLIRQKPCHQQSSRSSPNIPRDNKCLNRNHINSKSNELSSLVIPMLPPCNDPFINTTQLS